MTTRTTLGAQTETVQLLAFTTHLAGMHSLKLETGEVFQNPRYSSVHGNKQNISANLIVRPASDERDTSQMRYFEGSKEGDDDYSPPLIHFDVFIPPSDYSVLLSNLRGGIMPSLVTVGLRHDLRDKGSPVQYGNAPDGSEMIWRNAVQQNRFVDAESIEFHYRLMGAADDPYYFEDTTPPTTKASVDAATATITAKLADLEKAFVKSNALIVTAIIIACAVLYFARH